MAYFARAGFGSRQDLQQRTPELRPLADKTVALFGLGCIGAPVALELARSGVGELRILDGDTVDPATTGRWPLGLSVAGLDKTKVIEEFIRSNYPATRVVAITHHLGGVRAPGGDGQSDPDVLRTMTEGASLILDATAEIGAQHVLSEHARQARIAYLGVAGTYGGWGGKVFRILPERTPGCWLCYRHACRDGTISDPPSDPRGSIQPLGCADPTFTGAGLDMAQVALYGVRVAVSTLCRESAEGYPDMDWDVTHLKFRDEAGQLIAPIYETHALAKHPRCSRCSAGSDLA